MGANHETSPKENNSDSRPAGNHRLVSPLNLKHKSNLTSPRGSRSSLRRCQTELKSAIKKLSISKDPPLSSRRTPRQRDDINFDSAPNSSRRTNDPSVSPILSDKGAEIVQKVDSIFDALREHELQINSIAAFSRSMDVKYEQLNSSIQKTNNLIMERISKSGLISKVLREELDSKTALITENVDRNNREIHAKISRLSEHSNSEISSMRMQVASKLKHVENNLQIKQQRLNQTVTEIEKDKLQQIALDIQKLRSLGRSTEDRMRKSLEAHVSNVLQKELTPLQNNVSTNLRELNIEKKSLMNQIQDGSSEIREEMHKAMKEFEQRILALEQMVETVQERLNTKDDGDAEEGTQNNSLEMLIKEIIRKEFATMKAEVKKDHKKSMEAKEHSLKEHDRMKLMQITEMKERHKRDLQQVEERHREQKSEMEKLFKKQHKELKRKYDTEVVHWSKEFETMKQEFDRRLKESRLEIERISQAVNSAQLSSMQREFRREFQKQRFQSVALKRNESDQKHLISDIATKNSPKDHPQSRDIISNTSSIDSSDMTSDGEDRAFAFASHIYVCPETNLPKFETKELGDNTSRQVRKIRRRKNKNDVGNQAVL